MKLSVSNDQKFHANKSYPLNNKITNFLFSKFNLLASSIFLPTSSFQFGAFTFFLGAAIGAEFETKQKQKKYFEKIEKF